MARCAALVVTTLAPEAFAFCRTLSCELGQEDAEVSEIDACESDVICDVPGVPVHWDSKCLRYAVQRDGSSLLELDAPAFQTLVAEAFELWRRAPCPTGGTPSFEAQFQGYVGCRQKEAVCGDAAKNVNTMMIFDERWPGDSDEIGLTWPIGGTMTGRLVDADLGINAQATRDLGLPLGYVLAHEVGHFLGLSHSNQPGALMAPHYPVSSPGQALLSSDDIAAVCAAYPPGSATSCGPPAPPAYDECQVDPARQPACKLAVKTFRHSGGCTMSPGGVGSSSAGLIGLLFGVVACRRRTIQSASRQQRAPVL